MITYKFSDITIEHAFTRLEARTIENLVYLKVTEYDTESEITLNVEEALDLIEFLQKFVGEK